ncbi:MAG: polyamine aminopropyltransferase [archaeon GB-1867-005]|nr:polyamine aminopropyltransferase [Candidatus Culexmicrobium cathedralense]
MFTELGALLAYQHISKTSIMIAKIKQVIATKKSKYQRIEIVELEEFGRALILDGLIQSTEADEAYYHESLVHPAMTLHPNPKKVLIIGGGEGATLREVLKHNTVEKAVMVDIDEEVIEMCRKHLVSMHQGAFDNPKSKLIITDGLKYIEQTSEKYDVIILDLTDPYASKIASQLYTEQFYKRISAKLKGDGIMVTQAGNSFFYQEEYFEALKSIKAVFPIVREYNVWIPSFAYACNFILASKKHDPNKLTQNEVNIRLKKRSVTTKFFNGKTYMAMLNMPIYKNFK